MIRLPSIWYKSHGNLQYDTNREAAKISALSSSKIDKYEYLTGEAILPSNQNKIIEKAKFSCCSLGKTFEKNNNNNWISGRITSWCFKMFIAINEDFISKKG